MKYLLSLSLSAILTLATGFSDEPAEQPPRHIDLTTEIAPDVPPSIAALLSVLGPTREPAFIESKWSRGQNLEWMLESITIVSDTVVRALFTEGHEEVIGVFKRDEEKKAWRLIKEEDGHFARKTYPDPKVEEV
ncbi:MAG: hypothetical protein AAF514_14020, partial [Verrucomicrobiota bacterium]